jgi:hypothetical protein
VIINGITIQQAIKACDLHGVIPVNTINSRVKNRRENGTYNLLLRRAEEKRIDNLVVNITSNDGNGVSKEGAVSPTTMDYRLTATLLQQESGAVDCSSQSHNIPAAVVVNIVCCPQLSRQEFCDCLQNKPVLLTWKQRKPNWIMMDVLRRSSRMLQTLLRRTLVQMGSKPAVQCICTRLTLGYNLVRPTCMKKRTVYQAAKNGFAETSPKKRDRH